MPEGRAPAKPLGDARLEGGSGTACVALPTVCRAAGSQTRTDCNEQISGWETGTSDSSQASQIPVA